MSLLLVKEKKPGLSALSLFLIFLLVTWLMLAVARVVFVALVWDSLAGASIRDIFKAFYIGLRFDGRIACILVTPIALVLSFPGLGRKLASVLSGPLAVIYFFIFFLFWAVYAVDFGFYSYLGQRLNATLFELLEDFDASISMVLESYPVVSIQLAVVAAAVLSAMLYSRLMHIHVKESWSAFSKISRWILGFAVFFWAAYGQVSSNLFPLRWSNAYFSPNPVITALALNPVQNVFDTVRASKSDTFDLGQTRKHYPIMAAHLQLPDPDPQTLNFSRLVPANPATGGDTRRPPNVVIIIMESMVYPQTLEPDGPYDPTPNLKRLGRESRYYPNFYGNARTTARAVFNTITGIPDVTRSSTGSRNQFAVDQRVIAAEFKGYDKYYMLGGNTAWANIRGILANNIAGLNILEESYWKAPNVDVWGVSDYDLLMESHRLFITLNKPFLAVIQTASFHKPYTVPDKTPGFHRLGLPAELQRQYAFTSEDEYNSMRYADHALGEFFRQAKKSPYYRDTIFLLFGDHGINDITLRRDKAYLQAGLASWHTPLIIHAPGRLSPAVDAAPASQIDVFPTAASLAGLEYTNHTLGRDLLDQRFARSRAAFISGKPGEALRLIQDGYCYYDNRMGLAALYKLDNGDLTLDGQPVDLKDLEHARFNRMRDLAWAFQYSAEYLLFNNKKVN
ncbi:sulfatase-like hydrolase/transferase [Desulfovibrio sp. OttesenSCG-928-C14]|nr:sulfatase-like hydrolase/transferase [Desulfovibrio sp. OttesenSCG-928-C14]